MVDIHTYKVFKGNPYNDILFSSIKNKYSLVDSSIENAKERLLLDGNNIFHLHWEEFLIRKCKSEFEAEEVVDEFIKNIREYKNIGGKIVWTIHNIVPHEIKYFFSIRKLKTALSEISDRILVHSESLLPLLKTQFSAGMDEGKIRCLPHPSYPPIEPAPNNSGPRDQVLLFGFVRQYKGIEPFLEEYVNRNCTYPVMIAGAVLSEDYANHLLLRFGYIRRISFELGFHRNEELPSLFARAACLLVPSRKIYSSGVMMLALSSGLPVVIQDAPHVREILPPAYHPFLFDPGDGNSLFQAIDAARTCSDDERNVLSQAARKQALLYSPDRVSRMLGAIYDDLLAETAKQPSESLDRS